MNSLIFLAQTTPGIVESVKATGDQFGFPGRCFSRIASRF